MFAEVLSNSSDGGMLQDHQLHRVMNHDVYRAGFLQASLSKIQGLFQALLKAFPTVFKDLMLMKILI